MLRCIIALNTIYWGKGGQTSTRTSTFMSWWWFSRSLLVTGCWTVKPHASSYRAHMFLNLSHSLLLQGDFLPVCEQRCIFYCWRDQISIQIQSNVNKLDLVTLWGQGYSFALNHLLGMPKEGPGLDGLTCFTYCKWNIKTSNEYPPQCYHLSDSL